MDCYMLEKLKTRFPRINNRVVDPSQYLTSNYKELVQAKSHQLHGVKCEFRQQTIEQYQKAGDSTNSISSAPCTPCTTWRITIALWSMYSRLIPGGAIVLIVADVNSGWSRCSTRFPSLFKRVDHFSDVSSADICRSPDRRGIPFTQYHYPTSLDITLCFDPASEEGNLFLDFFTDVVDFRNTAPEDLRKPFVEYFGSSDCSEKKNGGTFLNSDWDAIVVLKLATT